MPNSCQSTGRAHMRAAAFALRSPPRYCSCPSHARIIGPRRQSEASEKSRTSSVAVGAAGVLTLVLVAALTVAAALLGAPVLVLVLDLAMAVAADVGSTDANDDDDDDVMKTISNRDPAGCTDVPLHSTSLEATSCYGIGAAHLSRPQRARRHLHHLRPRTRAGGRSAGEVLNFAAHPVR